jgi:tetratricopeptide (TPR) repeat protein
MQTEAFPGQPCGAATGDSIQACKLSGLAQRVLPKLASLCIIVVGAVVGAPVESRRESVTRLVVEIQRADYKGERAALRRLYKDLAPFADDKELGAKVRYWRGFALWRRAINGFNDSIDRSELEQDLEQAVSEFDKSLAKDLGFVDAKVGAASCLLNLVFLNQKDAARVRELLAKAVPLLKQAEAAEPENPRLLWVRGASRWYLPSERGGGEDKAIETYQKGLKAAREQKRMSSDPLIPSWGEPELLMNLAWSNLNRSTPDLAAAEQYARSALALVPYWHYVRDILVPQIAAAKAKHGQGTAPYVRVPITLPMLEDLRAY